MLRIEINTENAAFRNEFTGEPDDITKAMEIARIINHQVLPAINNLNFTINLMDINGNRVGKMEEVVL